MPLDDPSDYPDQQSWMAYCVPVEIENRDQDQAVAICLSVWRDRNKAMKPNKLKAEASRWTMGAARDLPIAETERDWDGSAASARMLDRATNEDDEVDGAMARRGFLIYDAANPELRGSYSCPFADVIDGELKAIPSGLRAAASRLPQVTDVSQEVKDRARRVLDKYFSRMEEDEEEKSAQSQRYRQKTHSGDVQGMTFVLSDETPDRMGDVISSGGWDLRNFLKNPIALFNHRSDFPIGIWKDLRAENGALRGELKLAPLGTSERIDEVRKLIEAGILKAVSVGFRPITSQPRRVGEKQIGEYFIKQELVETSLVSVPANPNALAVAKSLDISSETLDLVFAEHGRAAKNGGRKTEIKSRAGHSGKHAEIRKGRLEGLMSLTQRIQDTQNRINVLRDKLTDHLAEVDDSNVSDAQLELTTDLNDQIQREQKQLSALMQAEKNVMGATALTKQDDEEYTAPEPEEDETEEEYKGRCQSAVEGQGADEGEASSICALRWENRSARGGRRRSSKASLPSLNVRKFGGRVNKPYIAPSGRSSPALPRTRAERLDIVVRAGVVSFIAHLKKWSFELARENIAKEYPKYGDRTTKAFCDYVSKAESAPAMTTVTGWAEELVQQIHGDYLELLYPSAIAPQLFPRGLSLTFGRAGRISIPTRSRTPSISGSFVGEGMPIPVRQAAFTAQILTPKKMAVITTWTREMDEASIPAIEGLLRNAIQEDTAVTLDSTLLDDNDADAVRPAGLLSTTALPLGSGAIAGTTSTAATAFERVVADLTTLTGSLLAGTQGNIRDMILVMNPMQTLAVSMVAMPGVSAFPFMQDIAGDQLLGYPIFKSGTVPAGTVIAIDAADFVVVGGEAPRFEVSDQATLHMEDTAPQAITNGGTATPVRSLWQTDSLGLRLILPLNWAMRRPGMVSYLEGVNWS